jgi:DNA-binding transcriptional LysR family regulator
VIDLQVEHIDLAIRVGALPDSGLIARQIGTIREVVCAGPGYIARRGRPETPEDLANHDCVSVAGLTNAGRWEFPIRGAVVPVAVRSRLVVDAADAAFDVGLAGAGIIRLFSYQVADAVRNGALTVLLKGFEPPPSPVSSSIWAVVFSPSKSAPSSILWRRSSRRGSPPTSPRNPAEPGSRRPSASAN